MVLNSLRLRLDKKYFLFEHLSVFFKHETACLTLIRTEGTRATDKMKQLLPEIYGSQSPWSSVHPRVINAQVGKKGQITRDQSANICWIIEKAREFQKNIYFRFTDNAKAFDCVDHKNFGNS